MSVLDVIRDPRRRLFVEGKSFIKLNGEWVPTAATGPSDVPGPDIDNFDNRIWPLKGTYTLNRRMRWETSTGTPELMVEQGVGYDASGGTGYEVALVDTGLDASTPHYVEIELGTEGTNGFEVGLIVLAEGTDKGVDEWIAFFHSDSFLDAWVIRKFPTAGTDPSSKLGPAATSGSTMRLEVGPTWLLAYDTAGNRMGPVPLPAGYATNTKQGLYMPHQATDPTKFVRRITISEGSTLLNDTLASTDFAGAAGSIEGHPTDQAQPMHRNAGSVLERNGSGGLILNTSSGVNFPQGAYVDVATPNVDARVIGNNQSTVGHHYGVSACYVDNNNQLRAYLQTNNQLLLAKRVGGTQTVLDSTTTGIVGNDSTDREIRMVIRWPLVDVYYDQEAEPRLSVLLSSTDQSELGGGTRTQVAASMTKASGSVSPIITSFTVEPADLEQILSPFVTDVVEINEGTDYFGGSQIGTSLHGPQTASDATHQITVVPKHEAGVIRFYALTRTFADPDNWTETLLDFIPAIDNNPHRFVSCQIDGSGRYHVCGGMHSSPLWYSYSDPGHDVSNWSAVTLTDLGGVYDDPGLHTSETRPGDATNTPNTYPAFHRMADGDVLFTTARLIQNPGRTNRVMARFNHTDETWTLIGSDGLVLKGDQGEGSANNRGAYMHRWWLGANDEICTSWTSSRIVDPSEADNTNLRYEDIFYAFKEAPNDDGGQWRRWTNLALSGTPPINVLNGNCRVVDTGDEPIGLEHTNSLACLDDDPHRPHIVYDIVSATPRWHHAYYDGSSWTIIPIETSNWRSRQFTILHYDGHMFGLGRANGTSNVYLYNLDPGHEEYGQPIAQIGDASVTGEITTGWAPNFDPWRLRHQGILTVLMIPSHNTWLSDPSYINRPAYLVDLDMDALIVSYFA